MHHAAAAARLLLPPLLLLLRHRRLCLPTASRGACLTLSGSAPRDKQLYF
jgi:hypothetical protein